MSLERWKIGNESGERGKAKKCVRRHDKDKTGVENADETETAMTMETVNRKRQQRPASVEARWDDFKNPLEKARHTGCRA